MLYVHLWLPSHYNYVVTCMLQKTPHVLQSLVSNFWGKKLQPIL